MEEPELAVFSLLYREAHSRCFGVSLDQPLTETEGKLFQQQLLDCTGLIVGWRTLKNYSIFVLNKKEKENPSVASLDTLARYVLKAPYTNEIDRKKTEAHHPYWFLYREKHLAKAISPIIKPRNLGWIRPVLAALVLLLAGYTWYERNTLVTFTENFEDLGENALLNRNWQVINKDERYWARRIDSPKALTLFTLPGDNWTDSTAKPLIKNLLIRPLPLGCFVAELQIEDFIPGGEWQQAGLLLLNDTTLNSPSMRISLAFNDFFGGFTKPAEILVQAIATPGNDGKPEEFVHSTVLTVDSVTRTPGVLNNLRKTAIRIERHGNNYRLLYAGGAAANAAFKELAVKELGIEPRYIAIFALKGRVDKAPVVAVKVKKFTMEGIACN
ncbi:hypothetical protein [Mucilaginibacter psychrotolerans]|uniref:Uncharacterized protein n=1 Tax=Mucilaginibacter psychrotolerans TaxID=1524096 RepID=A0A4Y8SMA5_9SPHI|nr:hypothetical protein [Mucilaginibacter psychrotolerans]TFF39546.1 hypothetical protein E2R66_04015 [Mucilaginibacter psychrotolerans]